MWEKERERRRRKKDSKLTEASAWAQEGLRVKIELTKRQECTNKL